MTKFLGPAPLLIGALLLASCSQRGGNSGNAPSVSNIIRVKADLSLKPALLELAAQYQQENSSHLLLQFASGSDLQPNRLGDSVDVYILANDGSRGSQADSAADSARKVILAYAVPCIVVPHMNPALVSDLKDLTKPGLRIGIVDPQKDVLGAFAMEILRRNGIYDVVQPRLVMIDSSALELADCVARQEVDAAIGWTVCSNWVQGSIDVTLLNAADIPRIAAVTAWRATAPVDSAKANRLMNYLTTERSLEIFRKWGYLTLTSDLEMYAPIADIGGTPAR